MTKSETLISQLVKLGIISKEKLTEDVYYKAKSIINVSNTKIYNEAVEQTKMSLNKQNYRPLEYND
jgi:hypothetical protein